VDIISCLVCKKKNFKTDNKLQVYKKLYFTLIFQ
jgi:hypothetical protein